MVKQMCGLKWFGEFVTRQMMIQDSWKTTEGSATVSPSWEIGNVPLKMSEKLNRNIEDVQRCHLYLDSIPRASQMNNDLVVYFVILTS